MTKLINYSIRVCSLTIIIFLHNFTDFLVIIDGSLTRQLFHIEVKPTAFPAIYFDIPQVCCLTGWALLFILNLIHNATQVKVMTTTKTKVNLWGQTFATIGVILH